MKVSDSMIRVSQIKISIDDPIEKVKELYGKGQPVLIGTIAIETSELISGMLDKAGIPYEWRIFTNDSLPIPNENVIYMTDKIKNIGSETSPLEVLYHCNMGYPLLSENSVVCVPATEVLPRNEHAKEGIEDSLKMEKPQNGYVEKCYYHIRY